MMPRIHLWVVDGTDHKTRYAPGMQTDFPLFRPHPLLRGPHRQTIMGAYLPGKKHPYRARAVEVSLDDGDCLVLHDDCPADWQPHQRSVLLMPGLSGSHASPYVVRVAAKLNQRGIRTFRMDPRGCGMGLELAQHAGHAGRSGDAAACLETIADRCPRSPVTAVGFSMSANIILKMLGETAASPPGNLDSAMVVSPPIDILHCSHHMLRPENRIYSRAFCNYLIKQVKSRRPYVPAIANISLHPRPRNLLEFDERFTAPLSGFASAEDYYRQASSAALLKNIRLPVFLLASLDDPVIPADMFLDAEYSGTFTTHFSRQGGHMGYLAAPGIDPDNRWMEWRVVDQVVAFGQITPCEPILRGPHLRVVAPQEEPSASSRDSNADPLE